MRSTYASGILDVCRAGNYNDGEEEDEHKLHALPKVPETIAIEST